MSIWIYERGKYFIPLRIEITNWIGKAEGDWQLKFTGITDAYCYYYFKSREEAEHAQELILKGLVEGVITQGTFDMMVRK